MPTARATTDASDVVAGATDSLNYLNQVSRIKHQILRGYLGAWSGILGNDFSRLAYWDCFAGDGLYVDENGVQLPGSPQLAVKTAVDFVSKSAGRSVTLGFIERNKEKAQRLADNLLHMSRPSSVLVRVLAGDAYDLADKLLSPLAQVGQTVPTLFFVDPYGYPLPIPVLRRLLARPKSEVLVNLMWFRMSMDLGNPDKREQFDRMFGREKWREQDFNTLTGRSKEQAFLNYFVKEVGSEFHPCCEMPYSPEDNVTSPDKRTKYYLIHFSRHSSAALAMKEVMHQARKALLDLSAESAQFSLFDGELEIADLKRALLKEFTCGEKLSLLNIRKRTANLPHVKSQYRKAIKKMDGVNVKIERLQSKRDGLNDGDLVQFL